MKTLLTGSSGLIGSALILKLVQQGHSVIRLVRRRPVAQGTEVFWDPEVGNLDRKSLEGVEAVVHLAGENIAGGRWTREKKGKILESRVQGTRLLSEALAQLKTPPKVMVCASATGYYGDRCGDVLHEESDAGTGFLANVCLEWERSAEPARHKGIRVVSTRFGIVLSPKGGALQKMLLPFRMGVGGVIGSGRQYWSWISLDDVVGVILHTLFNETLQGPVNGVSPQPVTNREFTKTLGRVLRRPTIFPLPGFVARLVLGEMADALLLTSARVEPRKLLASGYRFLHPDLEGALRHLLKRPS